MVALHGKLRDSEIRSDAGGLGERPADGGEYELAAQGLEFAAQHHMQRVRSRVRFPHSVVDCAPTGAGFAAGTGPDAPARVRPAGALKIQIELNRKHSLLG